MNRKILKSTDPDLRRVSVPVKKIDKKIIALITDLKDTLKVQKDPEGVGLAAPQIGKPVRIFVFEFEDWKRVIINPKVLEISKAKSVVPAKGDGKEILEGCLSLPNYYGPLARSNKIKIEYMDEFGATKTEEFKGFIAQIVQHEIDHLEGILFVDRILEQKKPLFRFENDEWEEVELV